MKNEINWYEAIGLKQGALVGQLVQSSLYAAVVSVEELAAVTMECKIPMVKLCWRIHDRSRQIEKSGETAFPEGVYTLVLGEVLPLQELKAYETADAAYGIETFVTLAAGDEIGGPYAFRASLHSGKPTDSMPEESLPARLAAIPIASPDMTEEQLRQICLDYMGLQVEFPYRLDRDFSFVIESQRRKRTLMGGQVYGGIPYISRGAGNLYRIAEICDPKTGVLNTSDELFDNIRYFGNACSGAASTAWSRVVTSAYLGYTMFMCPGNGFLPVGPYTGAEDSVTMYDRKSPDGVCCRKICDRNGPETMYESYAMMKPADGLVCDGHVRMNGVVPVVVRRADGTIDPDESFTLLREQVCYVSDPSHIRIAPDGSHYTSQGRKTYRNSFRMLFDAGYLPFTFAEFSDPSKVQRAKYRLAVEPELKDRVLTTNYAISDVFACRNGKRYVYRNMEFFRKELKLGDIFPAEALGEDTELTCRLYNGELLKISH